jgi:hypothetical protein
VRLHRPVRWGMLGTVSSLEQIEDAVRQLSSEDLAAFRAWFVELEAAAWDRQIEEDVAAGRLDALADEALNDLREGRFCLRAIPACRPCLSNRRDTRKEGLQRNPDTEFWWPRNVGFRVSPGFQGVSSNTVP